MSYITQLPLNSARQQAERVLGWRYSLFDEENRGNGVTPAPYNYAPNFETFGFKTATLDSTFFMSTLELLIVILVAVVIIVRLANALRLPPAILLLLGGIGLSFAPNLGRIELAPAAIFTLFLPPLLFVASVRTSWRDFRQNIGAIGRLALGLVVITTLVVGLVAHWTIPGLPWAAAFALGAIVSPTDAVAATSITQSLGVPRRIVTILEGESLVNDATGLVVYRVAVAAVMTGAFSIWNAGGEFFLIGGGGILVGLLVGWGAKLFLKRIDDAPVENTIALILPFATYILADEFLQVSGVLAVVSAGFMLSRSLLNINSSETRLQSNAFWNMLDFLFNNVLFLLVGLQLRHIIGDLGAISLEQAVGYAAIISATLLVTRFLWVYPAAYLPKLLVRKPNENDPFPDWKSVFVVAWTGMRGAISLAAALALPLVLGSGAPFPQRNLVIFITFFAILTTLVLQGLTLPPIIRALKLRDDGETAREEAHARLEIARAALGRIEAIEADENDSPRLLEALRRRYQYQAEGLESIAAENNDACRDYFRDDRQLQLDILGAERAALLDLRERGALHEDAVRSIGQDLDLEEQRLQNHNRGK